MSDSTDDGETAEKKEQLSQEAEQVPDDEKTEVIEDHQEARKAAERERIEEEKARSKQRENDAEEVANPDRHRDEAPEGGGK